MSMYSEILQKSEVVVPIREQSTAIKNTKKRHVPFNEGKEPAKCLKTVFFQGCP